MLTWHIQDFLQVTPGTFPEFWDGPGDKAMNRPFQVSVASRLATAIYVSMVTLILYDN